MIEHEYLLFYFSPYDWTLVLTNFVSLSGSNFPLHCKLSLWQVTTWDPQESTAVLYQQK